MTLCYICKRLHGGRFTSKRVEICRKYRQSLQLPHYRYIPNFTSQTPPCHLNPISLNLCTSYLHNNLMRLKWQKFTLIIKNLKNTPKLPSFSTHLFRRIRKNLHGIYTLVYWYNSLDFSKSRKNRKNIQIIIKRLCEQTFNRFSMYIYPYLNPL